jgi:hypothetical protein
MKHKSIRDNILPDMRAFENAIQSSVCHNMWMWLPIHNTLWVPLRTQLCVNLESALHEDLFK